MTTRMAQDAKEEAKLTKIIAKYGYEVECNQCGWAGKRGELLQAIYSNGTSNDEVCPSCGTWICEDLLHAVAFLKARRLHKKLPDK